MTEGEIGPNFADRARFGSRRRKIDFNDSPCCGSRTSLNFCRLSTCTQEGPVSVTHAPMSRTTRVARSLNVNPESIVQGINYIVS